MAAYIKFDGVTGESQGQGSQRLERFASFGQGLHQPGGGATGATRRRGDVIVDDMTLRQGIGQSQPEDRRSRGPKGRVFPKVEIDLTASYTDAGRVTYYRYELKNVLVTSYNISGSGQDEDVPMEDFSLNFEEIKVTYTENDNDRQEEGQRRVHLEGRRRREVVVTSLFLAGTGATVSPSLSCILW